MSSLGGAPGSPGSSLGEWNIFGSEDPAPSSDAEQQEEEEAEEEEEQDTLLNSGSLKGVVNLTARREKCAEALSKQEELIGKAQGKLSQRTYECQEQRRKRDSAKVAASEAERLAKAAKESPRAPAVPNEVAKLAAGDWVRIKPGQYAQIQPNGFGHGRSADLAGCWTVTDAWVNPSGEQFCSLHRYHPQGYLGAIRGECVEPALRPMDQVVVTRWPPHVAARLPFSPAARVEGTIVQSNGHNLWQIRFPGASVTVIPDDCLSRARVEEPPRPPADPSVADEPEGLLGGFNRLDWVRNSRGRKGVVVGICKENGENLEVSFVQDRGFGLYDGPYDFDPLFGNPQRTNQSVAPGELASEEAWQTKELQRYREESVICEEAAGRLQQEVDGLEAHKAELSTTREVLAKKYESAQKALKRGSKNVAEVRIVTAVTFKSVKGKDSVPKVWRDISRHVDFNWAVAISRPLADPGSRPALLSLEDARGFARSAAKRGLEHAGPHIISATGKPLEILREGKRQKAVTFAVKRGLAKEIGKLQKPGAKPAPQLHSFALLKAALGAEEDIILSEKVQAFFDSPEIGIIRAKEVPAPECLAKQLRAYQLTGYHWLVNNARNGLGCILADDMGLGKTLQAISLMLYLKSNQLLEKPMLIVVPKGLIGTWERELKRWAGDALSVNVFFGHQRRAMSGMLEPEKKPPKEAQEEPPAKRRKLSHKQPATGFYAAMAPKLQRSKTTKTKEPVEADVFLTSYGVFRTNADRLAVKDLFGGMILDEAQAIKNYNTQTTQEVKRIAELVGPVRVALSGTPVENRLSDLHSQFEFILPGYLASSRADFEKSFGRPLQNASKRRALSSPEDPLAPLAQQKQAQLRQIIGPFIMRRLKTDPNIVPDLPEKIVMSHEVELSQSQRKLYKAVQIKFERERDQLSRDSENYKFLRGGAIFRMLQGLREVCNHPACLDPKRRPDDAPVPAADKVKESGKCEQLHELLEQNVFPNNEKALIFSTCLAAIDILELQIRKRFNCEPLKLVGDMSNKQREGVVERFQNDSRCPVLLLSVGVGGVGYTLTAATHVIHFDRCYNPAKEAQATDRAHRIGQHRTVTVHTLTSQDTFEQRLDAIMEQKKHLSDLTSQSSEQWLAELEDSEIRDLFRLGRE